MSPPIDAVIAEAKRYLGVVEQPKNSNRGLLIDYWLTETGVPLGQPWCAAFVHQIGRQAEGRRWPCPRTASVKALAAWASTRPGVLRETPAEGDLFLLWSSELQRFAHVGFVTSVAGSVYETIEGNTNAGGGREGFGVFARRRVVVGTTRFVRWEAALNG